MSMRKLLFGLAFVLILSGGALAPTAPPEAKAPPPWELAKSKADAARRTCVAVAREFLEGKATVEQVNLWSRRWMDAEREVSNKKADQIDALKAHISRLQELEKAAQDRVQSRKGLASDVPAVEYHRLEAELSLSRLKTSR
ncbi:MAG: hypothetical protein E6K70_12615 [Planctomycetota bacterium]|nr:MAG: hypothetical protein E6K70_12615 [Planctomycetota bacterium]